MGYMLKRMSLYRHPSIWIWLFRCVFVFDELCSSQLNDTECVSATVGIAVSNMNFVSIIICSSVFFLFTSSIQLWLRIFIRQIVHVCVCV